MVKVSTAFDQHATAYDRVWTNAPAGRLQRDAVWRNLKPYLPPLGNVVDLGCATGEDAAWLMAAGLQVTAIDASPQMVTAARARGVDAHAMAMEDLDRLPGTFDAALSNFGPLNCLNDPVRLRPLLAKKIRPGGHLALCVMGRFCLWETLAFIATGQFRKAVRRWSGSARAASLNLRVTYHTVRELREALAPDFAMVRLAGIGIAVPPSFVPVLPGPLLAAMAAIDRLLERVPVLRALSDHRLLIFIRQ